MKDFFNKHFVEIIFALVGGVAGFLYWKLIGCQSGTCPIKSVWYLSTIWGMTFGYLTASIIKDLFLKVRDKKKAGAESDSESKE